MIVRKNYPMKSDIREKKDTYILEVDLPGYRKEDIKAYVRDGYLILSASQDKKSKKEHNRYIMEERYCGTLERSFYIGSEVNQEDIKAAYKHGVLRLAIPKVNPDGHTHKGNIAIA